MQILWLAIDVVVGVVVAGVLAPFAIAARPALAHGVTLLVIVAVACIVVVSLLRHAVLGTPGSGKR
jgi:hypothetical protein